VLAYFKYANFLLQTANSTGATHFHMLAIVLPLGISFFTFTQIAYLADVYAGKVVERNPIHYLLFVTYFPHLIAGPVLHHAEMMPQFKNDRTYKPQLENFAIGLAFLVIGLAKKILIADSIAPVANNAFDNHAGRSLGIGSAWAGVSAYAFQIYFDFSGYSDMAVGLSMLVGVQLPYNFNSPYKARSIIDFWRRWHMTLSRFLRDYLYFALGGNRKGRVRRHLNLMITMLLGGLWHGASWNFVIWGGLHGAFLAANHGWRFVRERYRSFFATSFWRPMAFLNHWLAGVATMSCVLIAWVFFRAKTVHAAISVLKSMFIPASTAGTQATDPMVVCWLVLLAATVVLLPNSQWLVDVKFRGILPRIRARALTTQVLGFAVGVALVAIVLLALISARRAATEFIYFNF